MALLQLSLTALPDEMGEARPAAGAIVDTLREAIIRGTLVPGERVRQDALATRFGVSQMIVREAFKQLVIEGFLKAEPRRGVAVAPLSADDAWEMTELRSLIEPKALEWAMPRLGRAELDKAARIAAELDKARTVDRIIALNARFHETLYGAARQARTLAMIATIRLNFERYLRFAWEETEHLRQSQQEHKDLVALCVAGNSEAATGLLRQHILSTGTLLVERLRQITPQTASRDLLGRPL